MRKKNTSINFTNKTNYISFSPKEKNQMPRKPLNKASILSWIFLSNNKKENFGMPKEGALAPLF